MTPGPGRARARIGTRVLLAALVAVVLVLVVFGVAAVVMTERLLQAGVDSSLERGSRVLITQVAGDSGADACSVARLGDDAGTGTLLGYVVVTTPRGERCTSANVERVPGITGHERRIAAGSASAGWRTLEGEPPLRIYSTRTFDGSLVQVVQPIAAERRLVRRLAMLLGGLLLIALVGFTHVCARLLRSSLRPLPELADQLDGIAHLGDGASRVPVPASDDEIARLAERFNELMERLESAERTRRSVLSDASHELRTPVTALRMNMEVLAEREADLPVDERRCLIEDAARQAADLARLVDVVVRAAREGEQPVDAAEPVDVGALLEHVAAGARRPGLEVSVDVAGGVGGLEVVSPPAALQRVVGALIDNAALHGGRDGDVVRVELRARPGVIEVVDDGAGLEVEEPEAPSLLERFGRAPAARSRAGSGLGLAGARDLAERLGGRATIATRSDARRGACVRLELPGLGFAGADPADPLSTGSADVQVPRRH